MESIKMVMKHETLLTHTSHLTLMHTLYLGQNAN